MADTDPLDDAARLLADVLGATPADLIRAKCPGCRRWCLRDRRRLTTRCEMCRPGPYPGSTVMDLALMIEFGLSWATYQRRLETYGPPWQSPKEWLTPRSKWWKLTPPPDDPGGGVHHA